MGTIFIRLEKLLPEILEAQKQFDKDYDVAAGECRGSNVRPLARHYSRFNAVLKQAFEAIVEDTKAVNSRSSLEMVFAPKGELSLWFRPRGEQAYRYLSDVARSSSFNIQCHALSVEAPDEPSHDSMSL